MDIAVTDGIVIPCALSHVHKRVVPAVLAAASVVGKLEGISIRAISGDFNDFTVFIHNGYRVAPAGGQQAEQ